MLIKKHHFVDTFTILAVILTYMGYHDNLFKKSFNFNWSCVCVCFSRTLTAYLAVLSLAFPLLSVSFIGKKKLWNGEDRTHARILIAAIESMIRLFFFTHSISFLHSIKLFIYFFSDGATTVTHMNFQRIQHQPVRYICIMCLQSLF